MYQRPLVGAPRFTPVGYGDRGARVAKYKARQLGKCQAHVSAFYDERTRLLNHDTYSTVAIARQEVRGILRNTAHEYKLVSAKWPKTPGFGELSGSEVFQDGGIFAVIEYTCLPNGRWEYKFL